MPVITSSARLEFVEKLVGYINGATESIDAGMSAVTQDDVGRAILAAFDRQMQIRIYTHLRRVRPEPKWIQIFIDYGIPVRHAPWTEDKLKPVDSDEDNSFPELCIIDNDVMISGSRNWSREALDGTNMESTIVVRGQPVGQGSESFMRMWSTGGLTTHRLLVDSFLELRPFVSFSVSAFAAMGTSVSKASPLAPTFERMETWDLKSSRRLLQDYKDKDLDFGLDAQGLAELLDGEKEWAESIIDAFRSPTGIINALAFICGACFVSSGPALEKAGMIFEALDFDGTEQISMDEMTIAFLCCARGFCVMAGVGTIPSDEELESVTLQAYRDLNKGSTQSITKSEFTKWILEFASGTGAPPTREVALQDVLEQFRVVPPAANAEGNADNNGCEPLQESTEATNALHHNEIVQADDIYTDEPPQQEDEGVQSENASQGVAGQGYEVAEQTAKLLEPIEPEYVPAEADENVSSGGELVFEGHKDSTHVEVETFEGAPIDESCETQMEVAGDVLVDEASESQEATPEIEPFASDAHEVEAQFYPEGTANTDSGYSTDVAEPDAPPQETELLVSEAQDEHNSELYAETPGEGYQQGNAYDLNAQHVEQNAAFEDPAADEPELTTAAERGGDDLAYDQDEFAEETTDFGDDAGDVNPVNGNAKSDQTSESTEQSSPPAEAPIESAAEVQVEPEFLDGEADTIATDQEVAEQEVVQSVTEVDETSTPESTQDQESVEVVLTSEADAGDAAEPLIEDPAAITDSADASPSTDLKAFDTFNFESPRFDGSSGLPPPEPQELLEDNAAIVGGADGNESAPEYDNADPTE